MAEEDLLRQAVGTAWTVYRDTHNDVHELDERRCLLERHLRRRWEAGENDAEELTCAGLAYLERLLSEVELDDLDDPRNSAGPIATRGLPPTAVLAHRPVTQVRYYRGGAGFFLAMYQWVNNDSGDHTLATLQLHVLVFVHRIEQLERLRFNNVLGVMGQLGYFCAQFQQHVQP